jgi:predicted aspartyl protease
MRTGSLAAALFVAAPAFAATPEPVAGDVPPAATTVAVGEDLSRRMTVPVTVNGQGPFHFVIDTGADRTVISKELAEQLALPKSGTAKLHAMGGSAQVNMVRIDRIQISDKVSRKVKAAALPRKYVGADGLIGIDSLKGQRIVMDFQAGTMTLQASDTPEDDVPEGIDVIVVTARTRLGQLVLADADANGQKVWVIVDTGAQNSVGNNRLRKLMVERNPATMVKPIQMIDVLGKSTPADYTVVSRLRIGGVMLGNAALAFADAHPFKLFELEKKPSMLLGMESLRAFQRVSVDFAARKIKFLMPSGMAPPSDRLAQDVPKTKVGAP